MAKAKRRGAGRPRSSNRNVKAKVTKAKKKAPKKKGRQQLLVTPLPDPARQDAVKLGTLTFSVKAAKGFTINSIKSKLKRHGTVVARRPGTTSTNAYGTPTFFDLNNLFEVEEFNGTIFKPARYLSIASDDIDAAMGDGAVASNTRFRCVHVLPVGQRMTKLILELPASIKASAAASRILQQAQQLLAPSGTTEGEQSSWDPEFAESHLLSYTDGLFSGRCQVQNVDAADNLTDVWFNSNHLLVLLLPPGSSSLPGSSNGRAKAGSKRSRQEQRDEDLFLSEQWLTGDSRRQQVADKRTSLQSRVAATKESFESARRTLEGNPQDATFQAACSIAKAKYQRAQEAAAVPDEELLDTPGFDLLVDPAGLDCMTEAHLELLNARPADKVSRYHWAVRTMATPEQQQAADLLKQQQQQSSQQLVAAYKAQQPFLDIIDELQQLATFTRIASSNNSHGVRYRPSIAVTLDLSQGGRGKPARDGTLKITVWTWPADVGQTREHRTIDSAPGEPAQHRPWEISSMSARPYFKGQWTNLKTSVQDEDRDPAPAPEAAGSSAAPSRPQRKVTTARVLLKQSTGMPLVTTLHALLQQQGEDTSAIQDWLAVAREWDGHFKRDKEAGGLLLRLLKTGPQVATRQPRGFASGLTLKAHQLEALTLMKEAEDRPLGFNSIVWKEVMLNGTPWWLSLMTGKITSTKPPRQATGGILAQEMGLGKTLCCLAIILARKAPALGPGSTAPGQALPQDGDEDVLEVPQNAAGAAVGDDDTKSCEEGLEDDEEEVNEEEEEQEADDEEEEEGGGGEEEEEEEAEGGATAAEGAGEEQENEAGAAGSPDEVMQETGQATAGPGAAAGLPKEGVPDDQRDDHLVGQWADEAARRTDGSLRILQYHGSARYRYTPEQLAKNYDIVVTTYNTLGTEWGGKKSRFSATGSPLSYIKWWRIIFDEGHVLKNKTPIQARAACSLSSERRWLVTGTPIDSEVDDVHGLLLGLQAWPFTEAKYASQHIHNAFRGKELESSLCASARQVPLLSLLKSLVIRHTKEVLQLPPKIEETVPGKWLVLCNAPCLALPVYLSAQERRAYRKALTSARQVWEVLKYSSNTLQAGSLLLPLRRICSGGRLSERTLTANHASRARAAAPAAAAGGAAALMQSLFGEESVASTGGGAAGAGGGGADVECGLCLDAPEDPVITPCGHTFCRSCVRDSLQQERRCPQCYGPLTLGALQPAQGSAGAGAGTAAAGGAQRVATPAFVDSGPFVLCDSKLLQLKQELAAMHAADPTSKALIFSSFQPTVDHLKQELPKWGFAFRFINGGMAMPSRTRAIEAFQKDPPTTVFILTLRSAACGINLTAASHIFLLEPCMDRRVEAQAIGRAWRMGQTKNVVVKRLFVKGSIEERTMQLAASAADRLQQNKAKMGTLKGDGYSLWKDNISRLLEDYELPSDPQSAGQQQHEEEEEEEEEDAEEEEEEEADEEEGYEDMHQGQSWEEDCSEDEDEDACMQADEEEINEMQALEADCVTSVPWEASALAALQLSVFSALEVARPQLRGQPLSVNAAVKPALAAPTAK
eukprot:gene9723-9882_t